MKKNQKSERLDIFSRGPVFEDQFTGLGYYTNPDGSPSYRMVDSTTYLIPRLKFIVEMFNPDGSYNGKNEKAEKYALCLAYEEKYEEAYKVFSAVVRNSKDVLLVREENGSEKGMFPAVANRSGKLGYEGMYIFAFICVEHLHKQKRGLELLKEIVIKIPTSHNLWRTRDILVNSLKIFLRHGVKKVGDVDVHQKLDAAIESQY